MRARLLHVVLAALVVGPLLPAAAGDDATRDLVLNCSGDGPEGPDTTIGILENWYERRPGQFVDLVCWGHIGTHTYFVGNDGPLVLRGGHGRYTPAETGAVGQGAFVQYEPVAEGGFAVELSLDGTTWRTVALVPVPSAAVVHTEGLETFLEGRLGRELPDVPSLGSRYELKPLVDFVVPDTGDAFTFLRLRQPKSLHDGLSGYADGSNLVLTVVPAAPPAPGERAGRAERDCGEHLVERVFDEHPCFFGSTARYFDAPSFEHIYWLGEVSRLDAVSGSVTFHPYRSIATAQHGKVVVPFVVETSRDGRNDWVARGEFRATYGFPAPFSVAGLDGAEAQFVRLRTEPHRLFTSPGTHHWAGFPVQSTLVVEGDVLASARGDGDWSHWAWAMHERAVEP